MSTLSDADLLVAGWIWADRLAAIGCKHSAAVLARVMHDDQVARVRELRRAEALEPDRQVA